MKKIDICVGTDEKRNIRVRLSLLFVEDESGDILSREYISRVIHPGDDPAELRAIWDAHLSMPKAQSGIPGAPWPAIPDAEWDEVLAIVKALHTPERCEKRRIQQASMRITKE